MSFHVKGRLYGAILAGVVIAMVLGGMNPFAFSMGGVASAAPVNHSAHPSATSYVVTFNETGLPVGAKWGITFNGQTKTVNTSSIAFNATAPASYGWNASSQIYVGNGTRYVSRAASGVIKLPS